MEVLKQAQALQAQGRDVIHLSVGEPDFGAPAPVVAALNHAVSAGHTGYTEAKGLRALRERIADWYANRFNATVDPDQILITQGASGALLLATLALINPGDEVLMPDPSYACNRHFVAAANGSARLLPCPPSQRWQLTADQADLAWRAATKGIMVASPANPTGTSLTAEELTALAQLCRRKSGFLICDEIYQALVYDSSPGTFLNNPVVQDGWDDWMVINSFSKYFGMTGWRLGWLVAPPAAVPALERLAQNLTICAPTPTQYAALACFDEPSLAICEQRRDAFRERRDYVVSRLRAMNLSPAAQPDGAFYVWIDVSHLCKSSTDWCRALLETTGVCLVPGLDFSNETGQQHVRLSYARDLPALERGLDRIEQFVRSGFVAV